MLTVESLPSRLASKINAAPVGCWKWSAYVTTEGYGQYSHDGRLQQAHRVVYELLVGPIPAGLQLDHLCRVRSCVNPAHMEPVTNHENILRGESGIKNAMKTQCPQKHPYNLANTRFHKGKRYCRVCSKYRRMWRRLRQMQVRKGKDHA